MEKLVDINPNREFVFSVSEATSAKCQLEITNVVNHNIAFKIKTTAPKNYVVKPNTGVVMPNKKVIISITLTPIPPSVKDHKFMLQTVKTEMTDQDLSPKTVTEFWSKVKHIDKSQRDEYKLKVQLKSADSMQATTPGMPPIQENEQPEEIKIEKPTQKASETPAESKAEDSKVETVVENVIIEEEVVEVDDPAPRDTADNLYKTTRDSPSKGGLTDIQEQYNKIKNDISAKERELKELKEKEMQEDRNRSLKASQPVGPAHRRLSGIQQKQDAQFPLLYLIIAIFGGLILGMISAYIVFR